MTIKVHVIDYNRKYLVLQWIDPDTGKRVTQSSKCTNKREAHQKASEKEKALNYADLPDDGSIPFATFRLQLDGDVLSGLAHRTALKVKSIFNVMEKYEKPHSLRDVTNRYLTGYVAWMRRQGRSESTIQSHLRHIGTVLRWAVTNKYIPALPTIPEIARASKKKMMKGRPITDAEFSSFRSKIAGKVDAGHEANWERMAVGLWLSGLRLEESMSLSWDTTAGFHVFISSTGRPQLRIPEWAQKNHEDAIYPVTPDFAEFLLATPESQRVGWVFLPTFTNHRNGKRERFQNSRDVSRLFSAFGESANIVVNTTRVRGQDDPKQKFASAHDLRRSFGDRWSKLVSSFLLKELMRHSLISTTEMYYLGADADRIQDDIYRAHAKGIAEPRNTSNNTGESAGRETKKTS